MALRIACAQSMRLECLRSWSTLGTPFLEFAPNPLPLGLLPTLGLIVAASLPLPRLLPAAMVSVPRAVAAYVEDVGELARLREYGFLLSGPILWIALVGILSVCTAQWAFVIRAHWKVHRPHKREKLAFSQFHDRYLGIWSSLDEAINGLRSSQRLRGAIAPRWRAQGASALGRLASFLSLPFRLLYNRLVAEATDDFIWDRVQKRLQGNDEAGMELAAVSIAPDPSWGGWPPLPPQAESRLKDWANRNAAETINKLRVAVGATAIAGPDAPNVITGVTSSLSMQELVHTSYYVSPPIRKLLAFHIAAHATRACTLLSDAAPEFMQWYQQGLLQCATAAQAPTREPKPARGRVWPAARSTLLFGLTLLVWSLSSILYSTGFYPLTDDYQIDTVLGEAPRLMASCSPWESYVWIRALAASGRFTRAKQDAALVREGGVVSSIERPTDEYRADALTSLAAVARATGHEAEAAEAEADAFTTVAAISDEQHKSYAASTLVLEMSSYGEFDPRLLDPALITYDRGEVLAQIAVNLVTANKVPLAFQALRAPSLETTAPEITAIDASIVVDALLKKKRNPEALQLARQLHLEETVFAADTYLLTLAANGRWGEAVSFAHALRLREHETDDALVTLALAELEYGRPRAGLRTASGIHELRPYPRRTLAGLITELVRNGKRELARALALKMIHTVAAGEIPPWSAVEDLVQYRDLLSSTGVEGELRSALGAILSESISRSGDGTDSEVLGRPVDTLIKGGAEEQAFVYAQKLPVAWDRGRQLAFVSSGLADAHKERLAEEALELAQKANSEIADEHNRRDVIPAIGLALAHLHLYRQARLTVEGLDAGSKLSVYAEIIEQDAVARDPSLRGKLADARTRPKIF
jgi:hypothetical protein